MKLEDFLELEIPDATAVIEKIHGSVKFEWQQAYLRRHQFDLLNPQPFHLIENDTTEITIPLVTIAIVPGREITEIVGVVVASCVYGAHIFKDVGAELANIFGGRSVGYEKTLSSAGDTAIIELMRKAVSRGADAVVGVKVDFGTTGPNGGVLMASASGTAVKLNASEDENQI